MQLGVRVVEDAGLEESRDPLSRIADLTEHLGGVLAEPRGGGADGDLQVGELGGRRDGAHRADDRVLDLRDHVAGQHLRVGPGLVVGEHGPARHTGLVDDLDPLLGGSLGGDRLDLLLELVDVAHPVGQGEEARVLQPLGLLQGVLDQTLPEPVVAGADGHVAVGRAVGLVRGGPAVPGAGRLRHLASTEERARLPHGPGQPGLDEGDVHVLPAPGPLADHLCAEHGVDGRGAGGDVVDGDADLGGSVPVAGHGEEAADALRHDVEPGPVLVRAGLAEAADRAVEDVGSHRPHRFVVDAELVDDSRPEVLDDQVGVARQPQEDLASLVGLQVEGDAALAAVGHGAGVALPADLGLEATRVVAGDGLLDLDDVRAELGQHHRGVGAGEEPGQVEDAEAVERQHGDPSRRVGYDFAM